MNQSSRMAQEAAQAPQVVRRQLSANAERMRELGARLRTLAPRAVVTCARGSSDHAATFARYLIESRTPALTSSAAPSLASIYAAQTDLRDAVFLAISQSGRSPDLLASTERAKANGAVVVALCNSAESPLTALADHFVPLGAGAETSVAATKTFIASLSAVLQLVAAWTEDRELNEALERTTEQLEFAARADWSAALPVLARAQNLFVIGRGFGLGAAQEAALKLKETCGLHAEAFSAAEVKHGPMALVHAGFPVLVFAQDDETREGVIELASEFAQRGAHVFIAGASAAGCIELPTLAVHEVIQPMLVIQSFYGLASDLDPAAPPHLKKVTETR